MHGNFYFFYFNPFLVLFLEPKLYLLTVVNNMRSFKKDLLFWTLVHLNFTAFKLFKIHPIPLSSSNRICPMAYNIESNYDKDLPIRCKGGLLQNVKIVKSDKGPVVY